MTKLIVFHPGRNFLSSKCYNTKNDELETHIGKYCECKRFFGGRLFFQELQIGLHGIEPLALSFIGCFFYYLFALIFHKFFGLPGVYVFFVVALIGANLMVLKLTKFAGFYEPIALGTALFSVTYFLSDLVAELYGRKAALKLVVMGLVVLLLWSFITFHMLAYRPLGKEFSQNYEWAMATHENMQSLFAIVPSITLASFIAYFVSQMNDVWLFSWLKKKTSGKVLFVRNNASTAVSTLLDNAVFSFLAFYYFSPTPVPLTALLGSYIFSAYLLRLAFALLDTPFIYLAKTRFFSYKNGFEK